MSEQLPTDVNPPEIEPIEQLTSEPTAVPQASARRRWIAPAWFFFGILVGVIGFAAYATYLAPKPAEDPAAMRAAARDGLLDAIATMQAGGSPQQPSAQEPQGPQQVASNAFVVREANREGNPAAQVTIYEFSDFQ